MDLNAPASWGLVWVVAMVVFLIGELAHRVQFWFLPFAVGAAVAAITGFAGLSIALEWIVFLGVSTGGLAVLLPLGKRFDRRGPLHSIGSNRWISKEALVLEDIPATPGTTGLVQLEREKWRAESGVRMAIPSGSTVLVTRVDGTRLVVLPLDLSTESLELPPDTAPPHNGPTGNAQSDNAQTDSEQGAQ
jgi:membrane protein implicated in regulation of membrane protease activity